MKKTITLILLAFTLFSFNNVNSSASDKSLIIQFKGNDFEKRIPEIITNLRTMKGLSYLSHCTAQNLFVLEFDLTLCNEALLEKNLIGNIPVGLSYEFKEGTIQDMKNNFGNCLVEENIKYETK